MPPVAVLFQPGGYVVDCEVHGLGCLELLPAERHRHRGSRNTAWRIRHIQGLAAHVHVVIDEDLAGALLDRPLHGDVLWMCTHDVPPDCLADAARLIEGHGALDRHEHVQTRLAGGFHDYNMN